MPENTGSPWDDEIRRRLAATRLDPATELEIARELAQHLDDRFEDLRASGLDPDDARRQALADLDGDDVMRRELARTRRRASAASFRLTFHSFVRTSGCRSRTCQFEVAQGGAAI